MGSNDRTSQLIERFVSEGVEDDSFDIKSKEIVESSEGRKSLIKRLSAFANQDGGTVVIGVRREEDGSVRFQRFSPDEEVRQHLTHAANQYTEPSLTKHWTIDFTHHSGARLLKIDIRRTQDQLVQFFDEGEWAPWIRDEDTTREMTKREIAQFYENRRRREESSLFGPGGVWISERVDLEISSTASNPDFDAPSHRIITTIDGGKMVVCSGGLGMEPLGNSIIFHLETRVPISEAEDLAELLSHAEEQTDVSLGDHAFGYTIKLGDRQWLGRGAQNLIADMENISEVIETLRSAHESGPSRDHALTGDPRPTIVAQTTFKFGMFWVEAEWRGGSFHRGKCGFIMENIPFDDTSLNSFYEAIESQPRTYDQQRGIQLLKLHGGPQDLQNPTPSIFTPDYFEDPNHIITDNPFYDRRQDLTSAVESELPEYIIDPLCSVNRLPFQVSGGYLPEDEMFSLNVMDLFYKGLMHDTIFINALCWPNSDDETDEILSWDE